MIEEYPANPAEQLINILEAYLSKPYVKEAFASSHLGKVMSEMGLPVDGVHGLFDLFQLITEVEKSIISLEKYRKRNKQDMQIRLQPIHKFKEYLIRNSLVTSDSAHELREYLEVSNLTSILTNFNDDVLAERGSKRFSDDFVNGLLNSFQDLEKEVLESDLENDAKKIILSKIYEIISALRNYRLYGIENLRIISSSSIGVLMLESSSLRKDSVKNHPVFRKCFARFAALAVATVGFANDFENYLLPKYEHFSKSVRIAEELDFQELSAEDIINIVQKSLEEESRIKLLPAGQDNESTKILPEVDEGTEIQ